MEAKNMNAIAATDFPDDLASRLIKWLEEQY